MSPRILLVCSLAFTLLFNVAWAWHTNWLSIVAAAVCTLIVPAGLHLWPMVPAETMLRRILRAIVMTGVCAAAIITSFSHSVAVLLAAGWTDWTACSVTGGAELLVALSTMAAQAPSVRADKATADSGDQPREHPEQGERTPAPATANKPRQLTVADPDRSAEMHEWAAKLGEPPSNNQVRKRFKCGHAVAQRLLDELDLERVS